MLKAEKQVKLDIRGKGLWGIYRRAEYLFEGIYITTYGYRTILIDLLCGGVFRYNNKKYELKIEDKKMKLQEIKRSNNEKVVYENGIFNSTKGDWLMESRQKRSRGAGYKCFTIKKNGDFEKIIIPDHQLQALIKYGAIALTALGEIDNPNCVNHKNGNKHDNRSANLEIITKKENSRHYHEEIKEQPLIVSKNGEAILNPKLFKNK